MAKRCVGVGVNLVVFSLSSLYKKEILSLILDNANILLLLERRYMLDFFSVLKKSSLFLGQSLLDLFGVDYPSKSLRFQINYYILSVLFNIRYLVRISLKKDDMLFSLDKIYNSAGWLEREVWDMYGVFFDGNFDLRRILTDYGFEGFPLRKDYPLLGFFQVRFDLEALHVVYERVDVVQELRVFEYLMPWQAA